MLRRKAITYEDGLAIAARCPSVESVSPYLIPNTFGSGPQINIARYKGNELYNANLAGTEAVLRRERPSGDAGRALFHGRRKSASHAGGCDRRRCPASAVQRGRADRQVDRRQRPQVRGGRRHEAAWKFVPRPGRHQHLPAVLQHAQAVSGVQGKSAVRQCQARPPGCRHGRSHRGDAHPAPRSGEQARRFLYLHLRSAGGTVPQRHRHRRAGDGGDEFGRDCWWAESGS